MVEVGKTLQRFLGEVPEGKVVRVVAFFATIRAEVFLVEITTGLAGHAGSVGRWERPVGNGMAK